MQRGSRCNKDQDEMKNNEEEIFLSYQLNAEFAQFIVVQYLVIFDFFGRNNDIAILFHSNGTIDFRIPQRPLYRAFDIPLNLCIPDMSRQLRQNTCSDHHHLHCPPPGVSTFKQSFIWRIFLKHLTPSQPSRRLTNKKYEMAQ